MERSSVSNTGTKKDFSCKAQSFKLASKEDDWKLAGINSTLVATTRTRGGGEGRPSFSPRKKSFIEPVDSESDDDTVTELTDEILGLPLVPPDKEEEEEEPVEAPLAIDIDDVSTFKPPHTRAILELESLMETLCWLIAGALVVMQP
jgi:hypothetical protein